MKEIKEFPPGFDYDTQDLATLGSGSGIHKKRDLELTFNLMDRNGDMLLSKDDIIKSSFCNGVVFDITDENGNIVAKNYQSGLSNTLSFTERNNESVFGDYKKDFGVIATVIDETSIYSPSGYISLYANNLEISGIKTVDSNGTSNYDESLGVFFSGNLQPSGYLYTGKMYPVGDSEAPTKYITSGEVIHEGSPYTWEGFLSWSFESSDLSGYTSYASFSTDIVDFVNEGSWSLVIMDYSPNGSFLISSGSTNFHNPYGSYIDDMGSGYILDRIKEPERVPTGIVQLPYFTGQIPEDHIQLEIDFLNGTEYTEYSHVEMYAYQGESLDIDGFKFIRRIDSINSRQIREGYSEEFGLEYNQDTWLKFKPYSLIGKGESFIVGPLRLNKEIEGEENTLISSEINLSSSGSAATINYKERNVDSVLYNGSGVLDKIFVNKENPQTKTAIYESFSNNTPEYYSVVLDDNGKWQNTTFDYTFEFRKQDDFYSVESRKITIVPTGSSQDSGNFGYPLFKIKDEKAIDDYVDFGISYLDSGIMLLCNTSGNPFDAYKYYKTSI